MRRWIPGKDPIKLIILLVGQILDKLHHAKLTSLNTAPSKVVDPNWYFDIEAIDHITSDLQKLHLANEYHGSDKLQVGNGTDLPISHVGSSSLHYLKLPSVFVVPHITKHLLSVSKISSDNDVYLEFWRNHCFVKSLHGKTLLQGQVRNSLYCVPSSPNKSLNKPSPPMALTGVRTTLHG